MSILIASDVGGVGVPQKPGPFDIELNKTPGPEIGVKKYPREGRAVTGPTAIMLHVSEENQLISNGMCELHNICSFLSAFCISPKFLLCPTMELLAKPYLYLWGCVNVWFFYL